MEPWLIGILGLGLFIVLVGVGMRIFYAAALTGLLGVMIFCGWDAAFGVSGYLLISFASKYALSVIPLFMLMGYFAYESGIATEIFAAARGWVGSLHGGLASATALGCAGFGACTGSSPAAAVVMAKIAIPEMEKAGVKPSLSAGVVAASGTLASLIPPSVLIVIYGIIAEESIGKLLIAGIIPGIVSVIIYCAMIYFRCRLDPTLSPKQPPVPWKERFSSLRGLWGMIFVFVLIVGGLYAGVFTPSEAGGIGALGTLLIFLAKRRGKIRWVELKNIIQGTGETAFMALAIMLGIYFINIFLVLSGFADSVVSFILELGLQRYLILSGFFVIYVFLGMFVGVIAMVMITVPVFLPVVLGLGFDPIWFGILVIKMGEVAAISPPIGINVFVVHHIVREKLSLTEMFKSVTPFLVMDFLTLAIFVAFPPIITWLPSTMFR